MQRIASQLFNKIAAGRALQARFFVAFALILVSANAAAGPTSASLVDLGRLLFFDVNLSQSRSQSCASCHDPAHGFIDSRQNSVNGAASIGGDGSSLGDRNTPSAAYTSLTPSFHRNDLGHYLGGLFLDGRARTLNDQAIRPMLNPIEMALPDAAEVVARIKENPIYVEILTDHYGAELFNRDDDVMAAIGECISAFERTDLFAPFDSKYDRYLGGTYQMTALEEIGRSLFFSELTNCTSCHLLNTSSLSANETFTNYRYHNIGLPPNLALRKMNHRDPQYRDHGLLDNPAVDDKNLDGKFKVPSLRNVAVTAPYMHNGVFKELRTAILFYNKYTVRSRQSQTNPETGLTWGAAEIPATVDVELLNQAQPMDEMRVKALVAFLETLTDKRYENLLENKPE